MPRSVEAARHGPLQRNHDVRELGVAVGDEHGDGIPKRRRTHTLQVKRVVKCLLGVQSERLCKLVSRQRCDGKAVVLRTATPVLKNPERERRNAVVSGQGKRHCVYAHATRAPNVCMHRCASSMRLRIQQAQQA